MDVFLHFVVIVFLLVKSDLPIVIIIMLRQSLRDPSCVTSIFVEDYCTSYCYSIINYYWGENFVFVN
jgi:hypothetical protein